MLDTALGQISVRVEGTGDVILFWPSLLMTGDMWSAQVDYFSDRYTVILVDSPGHGHSEKLTRTFSFGECARTVTDILDGLGIDRAHFVGNSWGGMIGSTFAARYPDRVGHAVLMNCTGSPAGLRQKLEFSALLQLAKAVGGIRPPLTRSVKKAFLGPTTFRERPSVVAYVRDAVQQVDVSSVSYAVKSVVPQRPDQLPLLSQVRTPVLVLAGAEDATFPVAETKKMADAIPGAVFEVLPRVAHLAALEDPPLISKLVDGFISSA